MSLGRLCILSPRQRYQVSLFSCDFFLYSLGESFTVFLNICEKLCVSLYPSCSLIVDIGVSVYSNICLARFIISVLRCFFKDSPVSSVKQWVRYFSLYLK